MSVIMQHVAMTNPPNYMHSILITENTPETRLERAQTICTERGIDLLDRVVMSRVEQSSKAGETKLKASLGIDDVKQMQKKLSFKPFKGEDKAIIIPEAELLTPEAQNALLKVLEEPPAHTYFILLASSAESLLPTVRSRCQLIALTTVLPTISDDERTALLEIVHAHTSLGTGKALKLAEVHGKKKEEALQWIDKLTLVTRDESLRLVTDASLKEAHLLMQFVTKLQLLRNDIAYTNTNLRLALENALLTS